MIIEYIVYQESITIIIIALFYLAFYVIIPAGQLLLHKENMLKKQIKKSSVMI